MDQRQLLEAIRNSGCDSVHPGYGFLSEDASFARSCLEAGVTFVGPEEAEIALFGDKIAAKTFAAGLGVPLLKGSSVACKDAEEVRRLMLAQGLNVPIMLKAAGGGGGKGIQNHEQILSIASTLILTL